jgi:hypothetical protein
METLVICAGTVAILLVILGFIAGLRYISYRETLKLAERGLMRPGRNGDGKDALRWGIILGALGLALCIGLYPLGSLFPGDYPLGFGPWMLLGLLPLFFGLALVLIFVVTRK